MQKSIAYIEREIEYLLCRISVKFSYRSRFFLFVNIKQYIPMKNSKIEISENVYFSNHVNYPNGEMLKKGNEVLNRLPNVLLVESLH